jgi:hypothetical protein
MVIIVSEAPAMPNPRFKAVSMPQNPAKTEAMARNRSGQSITEGDSCAWVTAASRGSPRRATKTSRNM